MMFAIYDNGNMIYRNSAENISSFNSIQSPKKVELNPDEESPFKEYFNQKKESTKKALDSYKKIANMDTSEPIYHVKDIMTIQPVTLHSNDTMQEAYNALDEHKINHIPILTSSQKILGLIHNKMILDLVIQEGSSALKKSLEFINYTQTLTTDPLSDIRRVAKIMIQFKLNALPVVDEEGILQGMVSKTDIIKAVSHIPHFELWS